MSPGDSLELREFLISRHNKSIATSNVKTEIKLLKKKLIRTFHVIKKMRKYDSFEEFRLDERLAGLFPINLILNLFFKFPQRRKFIK